MDVPFNPGCSQLLIPFLFRAQHTLQVRRAGSLGAYTGHPQRFSERKSYRESFSVHCLTPHVVQCVGLGQAGARTFTQVLSHSRAAQTSALVR